MDFGDTARDGQPDPMPLVFVVTKGSKTRPSTFDGKPVPLSRTETSTLPSVSLLRTVTRRRAPGVSAIACRRRRLGGYGGGAPAVHARIAVSAARPAENPESQTIHDASFS